jgi:hypothetical protein
MDLLAGDMWQAFQPISDNRGNHTNGEIRMSNVIDFLEMIGQDARLRHASQDEMKLALANMRMDSDLQAAILANDQQQLEALIGASNVCCMLFLSTVSCIQMISMNDEDEIHRERRA